MQITRTALGAIGAAGVAAVAAGLLAIRRSRRDDSYPGTAAHRDDEGPVRNAGPDGMRSRLHGEWTKADEASDESFPASDPPATW